MAMFPIIVADLCFVHLNIGIGHLKVAVNPSLGALRKHPCFRSFQMSYSYNQLLIKYLVTQHQLSGT